MRNVFLVVGMVLLFGTLASAQQEKMGDMKKHMMTTAQETSKSAQRVVAGAKDAGKAAVGKVTAIVLADKAKGTPAKIDIEEEGGVKASFVVKATTAIYGKDMKKITEDKVLVGEKVKVVYSVNKEGAKEAEVVHVRMK